MRSFKNKNTIKKILMLPFLFLDTGRKEKKSQLFRKFILINNCLHYIIFSCFDFLTVFFFFFCVKLCLLCARSFVGSRKWQKEKKITYKTCYSKFSVEVSSRGYHQLKREFRQSQIVAILKPLFLTILTCILPEECEWKA